MIPYWLLGLIFMAVALPAALLAWRRHRSLRPARSTPAPTWRTRLVEAAALGALGVAVLLPVVWERVFLEVPDLARPEVRQAYLLAVALTAAGLLIAMMGALYRTWCGALLLAVLLFGAVNWVFSHQVPGWLRLASEPQRKKAGWLLLGENPRYRGVQLRVNGVHLGELPVVISMDEFEARVPYWEQPPEGLSEHQLRFGYEQEHLERPWGIMELRFLPQQELKYVPPGASYSGAEPRRYYVQVELNGEWGTARDGGGGGRGGNHLVFESRSLRPTFRRYDQRIREHLQAARQTNYDVDAAWFGAMVGFAPRGEQMLAEAAAKDPAFCRVMDAWAARQYDLDRVRDARSAWRTLERIAAEAEQRGEYNTASVAGAAVDRLIPLLDADRLADAACDAITSDHAGFRFSHAQNGRPFSFSSRQTIESRANGNYRPLRHDVLAHAVWKMDEYLDGRDDSTPNMIERRVLGTLVYAAANLERSREPDAAIAMGWPEAYRFMVRQPWSRQVKDWTDPLAKRVGNGGHVNVWLYRLLCLDTPEGQPFRAGHTSQLRDTADTIVESAQATVDMEELQFLFLDPQLGSQSPGMTYWPRFVELTRGMRPDDAYWGMHNRIDYLVHLEPLPTVSMYVEALRATQGDLRLIPPELLDPLPPAKRREILQAWQMELQQILENPPQPLQPWMQPDRIRDALLPHIDRRLQELERNQ